MMEWIQPRQEIDIAGAKWFLVKVKVISTHSLLSLCQHTSVDYALLSTFSRNRLSIKKSSRYQLFCVSPSVFAEIKFKNTKSALIDCSYLENKFSYKSSVKLHNGRLSMTKCKQE